MTIAIGALARVHTNTWGDARPVRLAAVAR